MDKLKEHWQSESIMLWHKNQFLNPKRNLVFFEKFCRKHQDMNGQHILDLACGGAEAVYFLDHNPEIKITGIDYVDSAFQYFEENMPEEIKNRIRLRTGDWYNLDNNLVGIFDGVISLETLSWLKGWKEAIDAIIKLDPKWIGISSLFYEGRVNYKISIEDYEITDSKDGFDVANYNIYSIPLIKEYLYNSGYKIFEYEKFNIDIDLPKPDHMGTGTYTVKTVDGERFQISAAMLMPWYFIYAAKD